MRNTKQIQRHRLKTREEKNIKFLIEQYHVISNNRLQHNELFWNFQLVFLTAQAFLLVVALGGLVTNSFARAIGAFCGFVFGFMSYQAFERNRIMEIADAELLLNIENDLKLHNYRALSIHHKMQTYNYLYGKNVYDTLNARGLMRFFNRGSSYELWKCGMRLVMLLELSLFSYHLFAFWVKDYTGQFLWCPTYGLFLGSISKLALGCLFVIFAMNWAEFMLYLVLKSQIKHNSPEEKEANEKDYKKTRIKFYRLQFAFVVLALLYSALDYKDKNIVPDFEWVWLILLAICAFFVFHSTSLMFIKSGLYDDRIKLIKKIFR